jgi:glycosyltransferase involved in cell wall biosynthesis
MKLVCMTQVYNQNSHLGYDGKTNIERFMESIVKYCDGLVVFDDASTDGSRDVVTSLGSSIELQIPSNKENAALQEGYHRARSLEHCRRMGADWVLCLDPDEVFEAKVERGALRALVNLYDGYSFRKRDLWRTDRYLRLDGHWSQSEDVRLFRLHDDISYNTDFGVRTDLWPDEGIATVASSMLKIVHFGYSTDEQIVHKYKRFMKLGVDLSSHLDDVNVRLCDADDCLNTKPTGPGIEAYNNQISEILGIA